MIIWTRTCNGSEINYLMYVTLDGILTTIKINMSVRVKMSNLKITNGKIFYEEKYHKNKEYDHKKVCHVKYQPT
jgi:hypothetical protein